ncbi:MAG: serine protease [Clostridiales bacterium]|nr:serine protease [Clostridiales bacterium]
MQNSKREKLVYTDIGENGIRIPFWVIIAVTCCLILFFGVYTASATPSSERVFENNFESVVEVKAETGDRVRSFGSAVLVKKDGLFVTNAHVVTYNESSRTVEFEAYYIRFAFESDYRSVELIKYNTDLDVAVIRLKEMPSFGLKSVSVGHTEGLKAGVVVYAVGNAMNYGLSITQGIVGIPSVEIEYADQKRRVIQCDLTIADGNSGGALLDARGKWIGITTFRTKDSKGVVIYGLAYCIPVEIVLEYVG